MPVIYTITIKIDPNRAKSTLTYRAASDNWNLCTFAQLMMPIVVALIVVPAAGAPSSTSDLPNFHKVHPYLYRGGEPTDRGLNKLKDMGIKTIIDLRGSQAQTALEKQHATDLGLNYVNLPMSAQAPTKNKFRSFSRRWKLLPNTG